MLVTRMHGHRIKFGKVATGFGPVVWEGVARPIPVPGRRPSRAAHPPEVILHGRTLAELLDGLDRMLPAALGSRTARSA